MEIVWTAAHVALVVAGAAAPFVAERRGADWFTDGGARRMRRAETSTAILWGAGLPATAALLAASVPAARAWALTMGISMIVFGIVMALIVRRTPTDASQRTHPTWGYQKRLHALAAAAPLLMASPIAGLTLSWTTATTLTIAGVIAALILLIAARSAWIRNRAGAPA